MWSKIFLLVLFSNFAFANNANFIKNESDKTSINKQFKQCMTLTDTKLLNQFSHKGIAINNKVNSLCNKQERNKAQNTAMEFSLELQNSADVSLFKQCITISKQSWLDLQKTLKKYFISRLRFQHICD